MLTKISKGYQITIPARIRKAMGLDKGSTIDVEFDEKENKVIIRPLDDKATLEKIFERADSSEPHNLTPQDLERMEDDLY